MSDQNETPQTAQNRIANFVEFAIPVGVLAILFAWSYEIVRPFLLPVTWGVIIAVALYPTYLWMNRHLGDRALLSSILLVCIVLIVLVVPSILLSGTVVESVSQIATKLNDDAITIPPPPESVADWPFIGRRVEAFWALASVNLQEALRQINPELKAIGRWLLSAAASTGIAILHLTIAIIISGVLVYYGDALGKLTQKLFRRLAGDRGKEFADNTEATIRSVARGVLGVALLQAVLAGIGFLAVGLPGPGVLAVICLLLATVQIGLFPVLIPAVIYIYANSDPVTGTVFLAWCIFVTVIDNVLKPLVLGRGVNVPMLVIFVGAIGGLLAWGIIGLFIGSVGLSLAYQLTVTWINQETGD